MAFMVAVFFLWPRGPKEPVHQGKPLMQWIAEANDVGIFEQTAETDNAMRTMGTNAVPFLLNEFTRPIRGWRHRFSGWLNRVRPFGIVLRSDEPRVRLAGDGLMLLETNAAPALPVLVRYLDDPIRGAYVVHILACQGDAALPYVTSVLASPDAAAVSNAMNVLQRISR